MSIVTPKTNFIDLLTDLMEFLKEVEDMEPTSQALDLYKRCSTALQELEDIE